MTTPLAQDMKVRADMQMFARYLKSMLPQGWGFAVLAFPFGAEGRVNYVGHGSQADIVRSLYEFITATKTSWGEHVPEGAAAEDTELGQLRQRVAELEHKLGLEA
jgi:hypothetical protein